mgnify:CR=1 FL=1
MRILSGAIAIAALLAAGAAAAAGPGAPLIRSLTELCEDVEDVRLVTMGTRDRVRTTHNFSPRADGRTDVMIELEVSLLKGGNMSVDINLALWTITYMAIESAYLEGKGEGHVAATSAS